MRKNHGAIGVLLTALIWSTFASPGQSEDWPQFLGIHRNGVSAETGLVSSWPADGPKIVWRTPLGVSMSGLAISDGTVYTLFQDEEQQYLVALKVADGKELWRTPIAPKYENAMGNGPRATPAVAGKQIFAMTGEGILAAFDLNGGKQTWTINVPKSVGAAPSEYGMSCSPIVVEKLVIVHAGSESAAVTAFDVQSGKLAWKVGSGKAGYSSPTMMKLAGTDQLVTLTGAGAVGINPATGTILWDFPFPTEYDCNTATPVQVNADSVLISAGENHGSVLLRVEANGKSFKLSEVWSSLGKDSQLRAEWQTPVIHDGHLYGLDNSGSAGPITNLVCIRIKDHKTMWQKARFGKSNLILADGRLYLTTMNGEVVIVDASPTAFKELGRAIVMETTRQAPSLSNGHLFVRDDKEVICIDVRSKWRSKDPVGRSRQQLCTTTPIGRNCRTLVTAALRQHLQGVSDNDRSVTTASFCQIDSSGTIRTNDESTTTRRVAGLSRCY